jgi:phosphatidylinositol alpha-1,6-mannosyltransferase
MAKMIPPLLERYQDLFVVFACRAKTPRSRDVQRRLEADLPRQRVRWVGEVDDLPALVASATAMPFPVDDLFGKVDLPYVLLEAALLRVPAIVPRGGPLEQIPGAVVVDAPRPEPFIQACTELLDDNEGRLRRGEVARQQALERHDPSVIGQRLAQLYRTLA